MRNAPSSPRVADPRAPSGAAFATSRSSQRAPGLRYTSLRFVMSSPFRAHFVKRPAAGRWAAILCALALSLLAPKLALAAAPMCDPAGMSVVAPIPALPSVTGELTASKSCDSPLTDELDVGRSQHDKPLAQSAPGMPERIVAARPSLPRLAGRSVGAPEVTALPHRPGFADPVYRPPRAG